MTSILFLVMGDMTAALIGRSFGQSICSDPVAGSSSELLVILWLEIFGQYCQV